MSKPTKLLRLRPEDFKSEAVCTGQQLARIVDATEKVLGHLRWHYADVEPLETSDDFSDGTSPTLVGSARELQLRAARTSQFVSGVFLGTRIDNDLRAGAEWCTEDDPFRELQGAQVEIRAFDTTYFDITVREEELLLDLRRELGGTIVTPA
jgi:hypothetical protein